MTTNTVTSRFTYVGLFLVTLTTLMFEILLTRIFSVTMWYHFAFVAISVAMFGMTLGALFVYLLPDFFTTERVKFQLALTSLLFALSVVIGFLVHLRIPFVINFSLAGLYSIALTYSVIAAPFVLSGIVVCLALTKFPRKVSRLYAVDLVGAALGCILVVYALKIADAPTAVLLVAALAGVGALVFAFDAQSKRLTSASALCVLLLVAFAAVNVHFARKQTPLLRLLYVRGTIEQPASYEAWNSFSRVRVWGHPKAKTFPFGWGLSSTYPRNRRVKQLHMNIDAFAYTPMTAFDGDIKKLDYLTFDITNLVHYVRRDSRVLVIGVGGGRDLLSALAFEQKSVSGIEINQDIVRIVNDVYGDYTGHLDQNPKITFINDEARSYVARQAGDYDVIQASLIDTYAATAAGAFVLSENSLYTVEAWHIFLKHLSSDGILSVSRWYWPRPSEMYRITSLANASLRRLGITEPRKHIVVVRNTFKHGLGVGTILVSRAPFTEAQLDKIDEVSVRMRFEVMLTPTSAADPVFAEIASAEDLESLAEDFPTNISAPTDDSPFFFLTIRLRDVFDRALYNEEARKRGINTTPVLIVGALLVVVVGLTFLCIIGPLLFTDRSVLKGAAPLLSFFLCIGLGFMLVEISQLQRLTVFLGHPTYSLSVVLFTILLASGLGSLATQRLDLDESLHPAIGRLAFLLATLTGFGIATPLVTQTFQSSGTEVRILVAVAELFPMGFLMGMAFPIGMKVAARRSAALTPWLWGMNGAASVCASVLAVVISIASAISTTFWSGVACYVVSLVSFALAGRASNT